MAIGAAFGRTIAPWRFVLFGLVLIAGSAGLVPVIGWRHGIMAGFDAAACAFLATLPSLFGLKAADMRARAAENDANQAALLTIGVAVNLVVLVAVGSELANKANKGGPNLTTIALIVATLILAWLFANIVYALHYAHIFYLKADGADGDRGGLDFAGMDEPGYWEFAYFSLTLGMTFQTSDVAITTTHLRIVAITQGLAAFIFNLGVIAFTINILGSGG
jgi:uncharacterized membrane protein